MNQNLYGQSEPSSLSCGFLSNKKQRCADLHQGFAQGWNWTSPQSRPSAAGSPIPAAGGKQGALFPPEKTPVSPHCVTHADLLLSPHTDFLHGNINVVKGFETL